MKTSFSITRLDSPMRNCRIEVRSDVQGDYEVDMRGAKKVSIHCDKMPMVLIIGQRTAVDTWVDLRISTFGWSNQYRLYPHQIAIIKPYDYQHDYTL